MIFKNYYNNKMINKLKKQALEIDALKDKVALYSDEQLKEKTREFQKMFKDLTDQKEIDKVLKSITNEAFAIAREAAKRVINQFPYIVQIMGALVMLDGDIAEMKTGEGKTLTSTMAVYTSALTGKGVHIVTVNEYLAKRDAQWMGQIYQFLGLTVGCNLKELTKNEKKYCYMCDITYTTNSELGFDYLRDNLSNIKQEKVLAKGLNFCIIDECDSILIDDARTPLIISGGNKENAMYYQICNDFVKSLIEDTHYEIDVKEKRVFLTKEGITLAEKVFNISNLYEIENQSILHCINNALKANYIMEKDVDYIVKNDKVEIVDENTGRVLIGRSFSDGIHQALEAKENVTITDETRTIATITYQNFFRLYGKLAGMTGTSKTEEKEFLDTYNMRVIEIPTNKPVIRFDDNDKVFIDEKSKYEALVKDIKERHEKGQPVLVGTISVASSEKVYSLMKKEGLSAQLLNAKNDELEASIIALAGQKGAITIATNMAGRGTDIKLGEGVEELGGLAVLGTERHDSKRIDNQLRGRSGRQGDVGYSVFYVSIKDALFKKTETVRLTYKKNLIEITNQDLLNQTNTIQMSVELRSFDVRKKILEYDNVLSLQREAIYGLKRKVIDLENIDEVQNKVFTYFATILVNDSYTKEKVFDTIHFYKRVELITDLTLVKKQYTTKEKWIKYLVKSMNEKVQVYKDAMGESRYISIFKRNLLGKINNAWTIHLSKMSVLQDGIFYRQYSNNNPLTAFKEDGAKYFNEMVEKFSYETTYSIFMTLRRFNVMLEKKNELLEKEKEA